MKKVNKWNYRLVIQGHFDGCNGWEDMCDYDRTNRDERIQARLDLREYRASGQGAYRLIHRRELNPDYQREG